MLDRDREKINACPVIGAFYERVPLSRLAGSKSDERVEERRAMMAADWLVRTYAPAWLHMAGLDKLAKKLESLSAITHFSQVKTVLPHLRLVKRSAIRASRARGIDPKISTDDMETIYSHTDAGESARAAVINALWHDKAKKEAWRDAWNEATDAALTVVWHSARIAIKDGTWDFAKTRELETSAAESLVEHMLAAGHVVESDSMMSESD